MELKMEIYEKDRNERVQELILLQRAAQKINSILDLDMLLDEIVNDVVETFGYICSGVLLRDKEANELIVAAVRGWNTYPHAKGDRFKIGEYGIVGHVASTGKTYYAPDVSDDPYYEICEPSTRSELVIPLKNNDELIGVFCIQHHEVDAFKDDRIQLLEALANNISIAIENAHLFRKEKKEKERMMNELKDAQNIQVNLFPKEAPVIPGYNISGFCLPYREVGGDWFDFIPFEDGRLGVVLADVSGKGIGAALLMSSTRSILRLIAKEEPSPKEVLLKVNQTLLRDFPLAKFVTMIYGILDPKKNTFTFSNAGHLYPFLIKSNEINSIETAKGLPLGVMDETYSECVIKLEQGYKLLFYTDGVTEAMNKSCEEYGNERLKNHLKLTGFSVDTIMDDVNIFTEGRPYTDDITIVMIEAGKK